MKNFDLILIILIFLTIVTCLFFNQLTNERVSETKLYILQLLVENKPKLENEELGQKVNEIYNIVIGK